MKRVIKTILLLLLPLSVTGQVTPVTNHYVLNPLTINAAYAGNRGALNISAFYRRQWIGIKGAPETVTFALDFPLFDAKIGLGLVITNDKIGVTKETRFNTYYSYKINMGKGNLSFGLGAGLITTNTAWSDLIVLDPGDEYYLIDSRVFYVPDFNFGIYYSFKTFFAGFSIPRLLAYQFDFNKNKYSLKFNPDQYYYLFNTGYVFKLTSKLKYLPSSLVSFTPGEKLLYDINSHFIFIDKIWIGASYRSNRSVAAVMQFAVNNQFRIAYAYDIDFGRLGKYSNGSHEMMLRYEFRFKVDALNPLAF